MVQYFSPGFLDCTQQFETRLTSGILLDAGMSWEVQDQSCAAVRFDSVPDLNLVVCDRVLSLNVSLKSYDTWFSVSYDIAYQFLRRIQEIVDAREQKCERGPTYPESC